MSDPTTARIRTMSGSILTSAIRDFGSAKAIARACDCSEATAKRYRKGETMPDPVRLARLMARSRKITDAMLRLAGLDDLSLDLRAQHLQNELNAIRQRKLARSNGARDGFVRAAARADMEDRE